MCPKIQLKMAKNIDSDQTSVSEQSDLGLECLTRVEIRVVTSIFFQKKNIMLDVGLKIYTCKGLI